MAYLEKTGEFQLKPIEWAPFTYPDGGEAVKFIFVNKDGEKVDGVFSPTKRDGSTNENFEIFCKAFDEGKSVLCEVEQGKPKQNGGFFYRVKWAVTKKGADTSTSASFSELKAYMEKMKAGKPAAPAGPTDDSSIPF